MPSKLLVCSHIMNIILPVYYLKKINGVDNFMDRQFLVEKKMFLLIKHVPQADNDSCAGHVLTSTRAKT